MDAKNTTRHDYEQEKPMTSLISIEKLEPRQNLERNIREGHKRPRYSGNDSMIPQLNQADYPWQTWCNEGGDVADNFDITELMMIIAENYDGNGNYDALEIGLKISSMYEAAVEWELDKNEETR